MYRFEPDNGREYLYKLDGNTVIVSQVDVGQTIFLRVEKEDFSQEEYENLKERLGSALSKSVVILPHYVNVLKISPMVSDYGRERTRPCIKCGGTMKALNNGSWFCFSCNNEIAPHFGAGEMIRLGD